MSQVKCCSVELLFGCHEHLWFVYRSVDTVQFFDDFMSEISFLVFARVRVAAASLLLWGTVSIQHEGK